MRVWHTEVVEEDLSWLFSLKRTGRASVELLGLYDLRTWTAELTLPSVDSTDALATTSPQPSLIWPPSKATFTDSRLPASPPALCKTPKG